MTAWKRRDPAGRKAALMDAARELFVEQGTTAVPIDEMVQRAGVAKGTFYLYFKTKEDVVNAIVSDMVEQMMERVRQAASSAEGSAAQRLLAFSESLVEISRQPDALELSEAYHSTENMAVHEQVVRETTEQLLPLLEKIIKDGIESGDFRAEDPRLCAWWVIGGYKAIDAALTAFEDLPHYLNHLNRFILRGLGYGGGYPDV